MRPLLVALALAGLVAGAVASAEGASFPPENRDTAALLLRLSDVPRGYRVGDDTGCGIGTENAPPRLAEIVITHRPELCGVVFEHRRRWRHILSDALVFSTPEGAAAMFADRREFFTYNTGIDRLTEHGQAGIGDEARLFVSPDAFIEGPDKGRRPGAAVFWRRGSALGVVVVAQRSLRRSKRLARSLALKQDRRMRNRS